MNGRRWYIALMVQVEKTSRERTLCLFCVHMSPGAEAGNGVGVGMLIFSAVRVPGRLACPVLYPLSRIGVTPRCAEIYGNEAPWFNHGAFFI